MGVTVLGPEIDRGEEILTPEALNFVAGPSFVLPDRGSVTMTAPMMRAYTDLLVPATGAARSRWAAWPRSSPAGGIPRSTGSRW